MAELKLMDNTNSVTISKSVYSYDILTLTVELGSALGLWLGMDMLSKPILLMLKPFRGKQKTVIQIGVIQ